MRINSLESYNDDIIILLDSNVDIAENQGGKAVQTSDISQISCQQNKKRDPTHQLRIP